jgi:hypothetical protein
MVASGDLVLGADKKPGATANEASVTDRKVDATIKRGDATNNDGP